MRFKSISDLRQMEDNAGFENLGEKKPLMLFRDCKLIEEQNLLQTFEAKSWEVIDGTSLELRDAKMQMDIEARKTMLEDKIKKLRLDILSNFSNTAWQKCTGDWHLKTLYRRGFASLERSRWILGFENG